VRDMTTVAVELNDAGVVTAAAGLPPSSRSPGFALLDGHRILVGREALSRARLKPRWVETRFWDRLDTEPLGRPFPRELRNADLVHAHLTEVWTSIQTHMDPRSRTDIGDVVLVVPGFYSRRQLELLLGVGRACGIPITGMMDAAVAASSEVARAERILHLDMLLHRMVLTEMRQAETLARQGVESEKSAGLSRVTDLWAKLIASRFVQQTRFDPFHHGETEQDLYDRLPGWIERVGRDGSALLSLEHRGKAHSVEISGVEMQNAVRDSYRAISNLVRTVASTGSRPALVLTQTLSTLPGLQKEIEEAVGMEAVVLGPGAAVAGALQQRHVLLPPGDHEVDFVTELPIGQPPRQPVGESKSVSKSSGRVSKGQEKVPSHLLYEGVAHPIEEGPLLLGIALPTDARGVQLAGETAGISRHHCSIQRQGDQVILEDHSTYGSFLNGSRIEGKAPLAAGDRLRLGTPGIELHLIAVE
jgi:hypothetical protein